MFGGRTSTYKLWRTTSSACFMSTMMSMPLHHLVSCRSTQVSCCLYSSSYFSGNSHTLSASSSSVLRVHLLQLSGITRLTSSSTSSATDVNPWQRGRLLETPCSTLNGKCLRGRITIVFCGFFWMLQLRIPSFLVLREREGWKTPKNSDGKRKQQELMLMEQRELALVAKKVQGPCKEEICMRFLQVFDCKYCGVLHEAWWIKHLLLVLVILFRLLEIWKYGAMEEDEFHAEEIVVVVDRREEGRRCEHFWWRRRIARILFRQPGRHSSSRPQISNGQVRRRRRSSWLRSLLSPLPSLQNRIESFCSNP